MVLMNNVLVDFPKDMHEEEAKQYVKDEIILWKSKNKLLDRIMITIDGEEVTIKSFEKSPIKRIRRITGYLSEVSNFNDAKRAELADRSIHM